jgi:hypothetical protein
MDKFAGTITSSMGSALTSIRGSMVEYSNTMAEIMEKAGITGENGFASKLDEEISGENGLMANSEAALEKVNEVGEELKTTYSNLSGSVGEF